MMKYDDPGRLRLVEDANKDCVVQEMVNDTPVIRAACTLLCEDPQHKQLRLQQSSLCTPKNGEAFTVDVGTWCVLRRWNSKGTCLYCQAVIDGNKTPTVLIQPNVFFVIKQQPTDGDDGLLSVDDESFGGSDNQ
jgi:hypothetical protein